MPVIPATREAEAGELFESGRQRLQGAEIVPLHSSLSDRESLSPKKKKKKEEEVFAGLDVRAAFLGGGQITDQHGETLFLLKIQKLAGCGGACL